MAQQHYLIREHWVKNLPALQNLVWFLEGIILRLLVWTLRVLPLRRSYQAATLLCRILEPVFPFTPLIARNFNLAYPEKNKHEVQQLTDGVCANLGRAVVELVQAKRIWEAREQRIEFVTEDGVDLSEITRKATIFITAHIGAWQLSSFVAAEYNLSMTSVYAPETNPHLHRAVKRLRAALPCRFVPRKGCMRELVNTLKQGKAVGFTPDLRLDGGEPIPFFGVNAPTNTTAVRLALHHDCALLPVRVERLPDCRFRITIHRPIQPDDPTAPVDVQVQQMTQKQVSLFESWVREAPDQWLCIGRRWPSETYSPVR